MNKIAKIVFGLGFTALALCACSGSNAISIDQSVAYAKQIYQNREHKEESQFSASYLQLSNGYFTSVDVRFKAGQYAYYSGKRWSATNAASSENILRDDYYLFSDVLEERDSASNLVSVTERYIFAFDSYVGKVSSSRYNVVSEEEFELLLSWMEDENRAQFKAMEDKAYDYLAHYDGYTSPVAFATDDVSYAPKGDEGDLILEANQTKDYQSRFLTSRFGSTIDEMRPSTDVYSEMHRFKNGKPYQIQDSLDHNKVKTARYEAAFTYGNAYKASYNASSFKLAEEPLTFKPLLSLITEGE